jgi:hypothetical protein
MIRMVVGGWDAPASLRCAHHKRQTAWVNATDVAAIASVLVAAATGFLALKTSSMATRTKDLAEETRRMAAATEAEAGAVVEQSQLTRAALQASIQPWLTRVPPPIREPEEPVWSGDARNFLARALTSPGEEPHRIEVDDLDDGTFSVALWLRNVGTGVALIGSQDNCVIEGEDVNGQPTTRFGHVRSSALPPGEATRIEFRIEYISRDVFLGRTGGRWGEIRIRVLYTDVNTEQPVVAQVRILPIDAEASEWVFHEIHYRRAEEGEPFAAVRFDAAVQH